MVEQKEEKRSMAIFRQVNLGMACDIQEWVEGCAWGLSGSDPGKHKSWGSGGEVEKAENCVRTVTGNVRLVLTGMSRHGRDKRQDKNYCSMVTTPNMEPQREGIKERGQSQESRDGGYHQ